MDFTNFDIDQLFGMKDDPINDVNLILPIVIAIFYGQGIQLYVTSGEIKKGIKKLDEFREESRSELITYINKHRTQKTIPKED